MTDSVCILSAVALLLAFALGAMFGVTVGIDGERKRRNERVRVVLPRMKVRK